MLTGMDPINSIIPNGNIAIEHTPRSGHLVRYFGALVLSKHIQMVDFKHKYPSKFAREFLAVLHTI